MNLEKRWAWNKRGIACKLRMETGNPGADELRERICELLNKDYSSFQRYWLYDSKTAVEKAPNAKEEKNKHGVPLVRDEDEDVQAALRRINVSLGLFSKSDAVRPTKLELPKTGGNVPAPKSIVPLSVDEDHGMPMHRRNINKKFIEVPKSPPRRALYDLKMERLSMAVKAVSHPLTSHQEHGGHTGAESHDDAAAEELGVEGALLDEKKRRMVRMGGGSNFQDPLLLGDGTASSSHPGHKANDPKRIFKPYNGDIFGTDTKSEGGMIYLSRMAPSHRKQKRNGQHHHTTANMGKDEQHNATPEAQDTNALGFVSEPLVPETVTDDKQPVIMVAPSLKEIQAKIHCAMTLCNWTSYEANTERLAKEGAVAAIIRLSKESDRSIRKYCALAFRQMSTRPLLAKQMVQLGAVTVISDLINNAGKMKQLIVHCTVALVNLTKNVGTEAKLVEDMIVMALMPLLNDTEEWDELCARGLFNLTCVDNSYPLMERVIKAFVQLASSSVFTSVKYICASALCNIADLKPMRMRMVEEGVVQVLGTLSRGADIKTRRLCAIIIHSLAAKKEVRAEMASRGAIQVIYGLSADNDMTTLYCAASAILRLATEEANAQRLISEGGISAISNVAIRCADIASTSQACAGTLHVLSTRPDQRAIIVQEGCIPALITMLRTSTDYLTLHYSVLAICNLLTVEDNQGHILSQGGVQTIVQLCRHEHQGIQKSCAFAIFTLSCVETARKQAAGCGAIPVIISLARVNDEQLQMFCAATLCMMSTDTDNIATMVKEGVIGTFISLLKSTNTSTIRYSCAALCGLAYNNTSCMHVLEQGAVPHVVAGALNGDTNTRHSCCAVISALSTHAECRQQLCDMEVLPALVSLSLMDDEMTRLRCAVAFANLSCESIAQEMMVKRGVVPILSELSISYSEENQNYCAKALCNLACHQGSESAIIQQGGMAALMMIGMVRTVNHQTKQIVAKAILNLITPETINRVVDEGLVTACSSLCRMDDEATMRACAHLFCHMSLDANARKRLSDKVNALHGLFRLMRSTDPSTKSIVGRAVCNLLSFEDSRTMTVGEGGMEVLREIATVGDTPETHCAETFFRVGDITACRRKLIETQTLPVIILLARSNHATTRRLCIKLLCIIAWHLDSRHDLLKANGIAALVAILSRAGGLETGSSEDKCVTVEMCTRAFFYLSLENDYHDWLVRDGVVQALMDMHRAGYMSDKGYEFTALTLRMLSMSKGIRSLLVEQGALELLWSTALSLTDSDDVMLAVAVTLYNLSNEGELRKDMCASDELLRVLEILGEKEACRSVTAALFYTLSLEPTNRLRLVSASIPEVLYKFLDMPPSSSPETAVITQNSCATVLMLSRSSECRLRMQQASLVPMLIKLSKSKNAKICDSASQALNCLSENSTDGIEEGTVAALIAIALDGNAASKTEIKAEEYLKVPEIPALDPVLYAPPDHLKDLPSFKGLETHAQKILAGPAGKGPKPPKPPSILDDKKATGIPGTRAEEELVIDSEEETAAGVDKIMMFAKMDLPAKFQQEEVGRLDDEGTGGDDFKLSSDLEDRRPAAEGEVAIKVAASLAKPAKAPMPASRIAVRQKPVPTSQGGNGTASSSISSSKVHHSKKGPSSAASGKALRKVGGNNASVNPGNASGLPDRLLALNHTELELKHPDPIKHGPNEKTPNFFGGTNEFLTNVRMPHEWVDEPLMGSGAGGNNVASAEAAAAAATAPKQVSVAEKAAELGLWNDGGGGQGK